jgi:hypothetical protein
VSCLRESRDRRQLQPDYPRPPLQLAVQHGVVLAHESELAVIADAKHAERGRRKARVVTVFHPHIANAGGDEQTPAGIDAEGAHVVRLRVDTLDAGVLAGALVDGEDRDAIFAPGKHLLAVEFDFGVGAVGSIDEFAVGVHMNGAGGLVQLRVARTDERGFDEGRGGFDAVAGNAMHVHFVLAFDIGVEPRLRRVIVDVPRAIIEAVLAADDVLRRGELPVFEKIDLDCAGVFRLAVLGVVATRGEHHQLVRWRYCDL